MKVGFLSPKRRKCLKGPGLQCFIETDKMLLLPQLTPELKSRAREGGREQSGGEAGLTQSHLTSYWTAQFPM